jgi:hypothetical protein
MGVYSAMADIWSDKFTLEDFDPRIKRHVEPMPSDRTAEPQWNRWWDDEQFDHPAPGDTVCVQYTPKLTNLYWAGCFDAGAAVV